MNADTIFGVVIVLGVILVSMTLHELMHGMVAYWLGDDTAKLQGRLTLNPLKHIDPFLTIALPLLLLLAGQPIFGGAKPVPFNPGRLKYDEWGAALVAVAGPLTNFIIAFISFGIATLLGFNVIGTIYGSAGSNIIATVLAYGVIVNLGFFVFNLIPIPPLDGSRVLYALAPEFVRRGMEIIEQYGLVVVFLLVVFLSGLIGEVMVGVINLFLQLFATIFIR